MVLDLKVLVKNFNCEDRSCYAGNPCESCFREFAIVGYYESLSLYTLQLVKGYHLLPPVSPAGEWYRTFTLPFIGSSQASRGEASPQPNTMVLKHILPPAAGTA